MIIPGRTGGRGLKDVLNLGLEHSRSLCESVKIGEETSDFHGLMCYWNVWKVIDRFRENTLVGLKSWVWEVQCLHSEGGVGML